MEVMNGCTIAYKSLGAGTFDYTFVVDNEFFSRFEGSEITAGNCGVEVQLQRGESMLEIGVKIQGEVMVECDRCLEPCAIEVDYHGELIVKFSTEVEEYDGEIMWLSPLQSEIDLAQYIYESIVLSLPYQRVHPEGQCNEEMISKFATISAEQLTALEAKVAEEGEGEGAEEESHGLNADDLAKLQALKAKMEEK